MKTYVTFGQVHTHSVNGKTLDKDTVAVLEATTAQEGRALAEELFGLTFCTTYAEGYWSEDMLNYYPKGLVYINCEENSNDPTR